MSLSPEKRRGLRALLLEFQAEDQRKAAWAEWDRNVDTDSAPERVKRLSRHLEIVCQHVGWDQGLDWCLDVWLILLSKYSAADSEAKYMAAIKGVDRRALDACAAMFGELQQHFCVEGKFADILGQMYMDFASGHKQAGLGQYFTPWVVCLFMAQMTICSGDGADDNDYLTVNEPACGSGALLLAARAARAMKVGRSRAMRMKLTGQDIDGTCVKMSRVQITMSDDRFMTSWLICNLHEMKQLIAAANTAPKPANSPKTARV